MSIGTCINALIDAGEITKDQGDELRGVWRKLRSENEKLHAPETADAIAKERMVELLEDSVSRKKALANRRVNAIEQIDRQMREHPQGLATGALTHLVRDLEASKAAPWANVEGVHRAILGQLHALWAEGITALRPKGAGAVRSKTLQRSVLRELFGENTGDATAREAAKGFSEAAEFARRMFNRHGGNIMERQDWGLPQSHDMRQVGKVTKQEWVDYIMPRLNRDKMIDFETKLPLDDDRLADLLSHTYDRIRTNGLIDLNPGTPKRHKLLANRHQDHRFLVFRDSDSWLEYQQRFGGGDIYGTMTQHLDVMAKDIALLKVLGPDPDGMVRFMTDTIRKEAAIAGEKNIDKGIGFIRDTYDIITDRINEGADKFWPRFFAGGRNLLTSAQLGAAVLSAITDFGFARVTSRFNGIPASRVMGNYLKQMNPASNADRTFAIQMGLVAESWTSVALAQKRFFGEVMGPRWTQLFSDVVLRASLLTPHTQAMRHAFGLEFLGYLGRNAGKAVDELDKPIQDMFGRYGISADDWEVIRKAPMYERDGAKFINLNAIARIGDGEAAYKLQRGVLTETDFATPVPGVRERAITTGGTRPTGSFGQALAGQIMRSVAMYKTFPVTVITGHMMRGLLMGTRGGGKGQAGKYLANLFITTTLMGALAFQAKQMSKGKDPIPMNPNTEEGKKLWMAAMMQGGGIGIFGDFLFSDFNRFGSSPAMTFAGPVAKFADDVYGLTIGNIQQAALNEETNAGRELVRFMGRYFPGGSLWYTRLAFERLVTDQLQMMVDDKARSSFRRRETMARKDFGQRYWWRPGQTSPQRPPDIQNITEGR